MALEGPPRRRRWRGWRPGQVPEDVASVGPMWRPAGHEFDDHDDGTEATRSVSSGPGRIEPTTTSGTRGAVRGSVIACSVCTDGTRSEGRRAPNRAGAVHEDVRPYPRYRADRHSGIMSERANHRDGASRRSGVAVIGVTHPDWSVVVIRHAPGRLPIAAGAPLTIVITVDAATSRELFDSAGPTAAALAGW